MPVITTCPFSPLPPRYRPTFDLSPIPQPFTADSAGSAGSAASGRCRLLRPVPFRLSPLDIGQHLTCPQFLSRLQRIQRVQRVQRLLVDAGYYDLSLFASLPSI